MKLRCPHVTGRRTLGSMLMLTFLTAPAIAQRGLPYRIDPPPGSVFFGGSVASGGDANRDGCQDVFVMDHEYEENGVVLGRSFMYSGCNGAELWRFVGSHELAELRSFRYVVGAFIGDIDGDQCDDVALGQPGADAGHGRVDVLSGRTGAVIYSYDGQPESELGRDVAGVGDVDGDMIPDFAFVAAWSPEGGVSVRSGRTGAEIYAIAQPWVRSIAPAGDIDGDQRADFAAGSWKFTGLGIKVYSGAEASVIYDLGRPDPVDSMFGWEVAGGFDLNGDQVSDLVASGEDNSPYARFARAYLIDGRTGEAQMIAHNRLDNLFGITIALADLNGNGTTETVIAAQQAMFVYDAFTQQLLHWSAPPVLGRPGLSGTEVAVGDVNGDGAADFITQDIFGAGGVLIRAGAPILLHPQDYTVRYRTSQPFQLVAYVEQPGRDVHFLASRRGVSCTFIPRLNVCIDLARPFARVGYATSDAEGNAIIELDPANTPSGPVWLQALDPGDPARPAITSNVLEIEILD